MVIITKVQIDEFVSNFSLNAWNIEKNKKQNKTKKQIQFQRPPFFDKNIEVSILYLRQNIGSRAAKLSKSIE